MKQNKLLVISFILNILVVLSVITGTIITMTIGADALSGKSLSVFKYFTFQSNVFVGIVALIYAFYQFQIIRQKKSKIPHVLAVFNHVGVTAVGLTFVIVVAFLAPGYGYDKMYNKANLFFHALTPVFAIINYLFFEKENKVRFIETLYSTIPPLSYGVVYFIIVASQNAYGNLKIDFYNFGGNGPLMGVVNFVSIVVIAYTIGLFLFYINNLVFKKRR